MKKNNGDPCTPRQAEPSASQEQAESKTRASQEQAEQGSRARKPSKEAEQGRQEVIAKRWTLSMAAMTMYRVQFGKAFKCCYEECVKHQVGLAQELLEVIDRYAEVKHSWKMELDSFLEMQDDEAAKFAERFKKVYEEFTRGELNCWEQWAKRLKKENTKRWLRKLRVELVQLTDFMIQCNSYCKESRRYCDLVCLDKKFLSLLERATTMQEKKAKQDDAEVSLEAKEAIKEVWGLIQGKEKQARNAIILKKMKMLTSPCKEHFIHGLRFVWKRHKIFK